MFWRKPKKPTVPVIRGPVIRLDIFGRWHTYEPKITITAYQAAQLLKLFSVASHTCIGKEGMEIFITTHNLREHFDPEE